MFQSHTADILVPPPLCLLPPSSIQAFMASSLCPAASLPSPHLSCLINCQGSRWAYAKACIFSLLQSTLLVDNAAAAECVEEERCVDLFFSAG